LLADKSKDWSLSEWVTNFLKDDPYYEDDEALYGDYMDDTMDVGEEDYLDAGGLVESILILGITFSLVLLLWYRQRMQQAHAQAEEARRQGQGQGPQQQQMPGPGANPANPFDGFGGWAAGGMGL
jgi:SEL1 protein